MIYFGDAVPGNFITQIGPDFGSDWVAYTDELIPIFGDLRLNSVDRTAGDYYPFTVQDIGPLGLGQTPTGAFSYPGAGSGGKDQAYVFAFYNPNLGPGGLIEPPPPPNVIPGSILTKSDDPTQPRNFRHLFTFSPCCPPVRSFFQIAPWVVRNSEFSGLPANTGDGLVMLGQGGPANSVHLAWMPLVPGKDPDISQAQYFCDRKCPDPTRRWSTDQTKAVTLFSTIGYTSMSLAWLPGPRVWLLLYSLASPGKAGDATDPHNPNGPVVARVGKTPWSWSDEIIIFDPLREYALGKFMHRPGCDSLIRKPDTPPVVDTWAYDGRPGWAYGPFLLNRYTQWDQPAQMATIYYVMSTSTPYQVQLMRTKLPLSHFSILQAPGRGN
jgi:hypothetical protein